MASEAGIDDQKLKSCVVSGRPDSTIERNRAEGTNQGIRSTPTYFVNGKMVVGQKSLELEIIQHMEENND
jgi:protein-disulfide isomerase